MVELLPCPFCGSKAELAHNPFDQGMTIAACVSCGAAAFHKKWNRRTSAIAQARADGERAGRAAALKEAAKAISELYKSFTSHQSKTALITARNSLRALIEESP